MGLKLTQKIRLCRSLRTVVFLEEASRERSIGPHIEIRKLLTFKDGARISTNKGKE